MQKRFRDEPYLREATAKVTAVDGAWVKLDAPILFAFSGGQQSDIGTIAGHDVLESEELKDGTIRHRLPEDHGLRPGDSVEQRVDWDVRHRVMRVHSATHVAYAAVSEVMGEARDLIGSNVHVTKGRLDWEMDSPIGPLLADATARVNDIVGRDLEIARFPEETNPDHWVWEVSGDDLPPELWRMPCGGTHVKRTGEIGEVKLKRKNIGKGKERVEVSLVD